MKKMEKAAKSLKKPIKSIKIVKYKPIYKKAIEEICWETAFFGEKGTPLVEDKRLIVDFLSKYYFEHESDKIFVALHKGKVVGYLFGCIDSAKHQEIFEEEVMPDISKRFIKGNYKLGMKTLQFLFSGLIWYAIFEKKLKLPFKNYPAHLHINIKEGFRRYGIGTKLQVEYFKYLLSKGIKGLHLITTSHHKLANPFYNKLGFRIYNKKPTKMWSHVTKETVYFRVYVIKITKELIRRWNSMISA